MTAMDRRAIIRIAALILSAGWSLTWAASATAAPPRPAVPVAIYEDTKAILAQSHADVIGEDASDPDAPPVSAPEDFMFRPFDINGDGIADWRVNFAGFDYGFCGTGGCLTRVFVSRGDGSFALVLDQQVLQLAIEPSSGRGALLTIGVHGTYCKATGSTECLLAFRWNEGQFAFEPVASPRASVRLHGFEFLPGGVQVPAPLTAELRKGEAGCFKITGKRNEVPTGSAVRAPDFDGDGRADWLLVGGYCPVIDDKPQALATSLWLDRPEGLRKVLDWPAGGHSIDIGGARPVFNGEGTDDCFYGMGECDATSFAWSSVTQSMEAFATTSLAESDLALLAAGEALIADGFPGSISAAQLADHVALSERLAAVRAPIDPVLGRAWLIEGALRIARGDAAGAEAKLRRAKDIFAFAGEEFAPQRAMTMLALARSIEAPARREERAGAAQTTLVELDAEETVPETWQARRAWEIYLASTRCETSCFPGREQLARLYRGGVGDGPDAFVDRHAVRRYEAELERSELRWSAALAIDQALLAETLAAGPAAAARLAEEQRAVATDMVGLGRFGEAVAISQASLEAVSSRYGASDPRTLGAASDHGALLLEAGQARESEALLSRIFPAIAALPEPGPAAPLVQRRLADTALALGRLDEARAALEQARAAERNLPIEDILAQNYDASLTARALGRLRALSGDGKAAVAAFDEGLKLVTFTLEPRPASVAFLLDYLEFAPPIGDRERLDTLGATVQAITPTLKAIAEQVAQMAAQAYPEGHPMIARAARIKARILIGLSDEAARDAAEEALGAAATTPGDGMTTGLEARTDLARLLAVAGGTDAPRALELARQSVKIASERRSRMRTGGGSAVDPELKRAFVGFALAASASRPEGLALSPEIADETFRALQDAEVSQAAVAIARATLARQAAGTPAAADVTRLNAGEERLRGLDRLYVGALGKGDGASAEQLRGEIDAETTSLREIDSRLRLALPTYAALSDQRPLTLAEAQARLADDAALLLMTGDDRDMATMLVTRDNAYLTVARGYAPTFEAAADRLRCSVEPDKCSEAAARSLDAAVIAAGLDPLDLAPFDRVEAQAIYEALIAPLASHVPVGTTLLVVQQGAIGRVPVAVLPVAALQTADAFDTAKMADVTWLIDRYPLALLPSVSVLTPQAAVADAAAGPRFIGFGNPVFTGEAADARGLKGLARSALGGELVSPADLNLLAPLPGTQRELEAMRDLMKAAAADVVTGAAANEGAIKADARLGDASVVAFATHGLLPSEVAGLAEPGLVFTPPKVATARDDGFLTASEVAAFHLSADVVILSACNTASTSGEPGADSLSALARSFLLAGARSVLATRWSVPDDATAALTVETLRLRASGDRVNQAKALQAAMVAVRRGQRSDGSPIAGADPIWAHPLAWGAFVAIGSGR